MTEAEWLTTTNPSRLLEFLQDQATDRKLILFIEACLRSLEGIPADEWYWETVDNVELHSRQWDALGDAISGIKARLVMNQDFETASKVRDLEVAFNGGRVPEFHETKRDKAMRVARLSHFSQDVYSRAIRDILGNPFRPVAFDSEWRSDTALSLAKHIYEARDFAQMPILADALQDAGCDNADILSHCRDSQQVHVRGCWVADLVLGKN